MAAFCLISTTAWTAEFVKGDKGGFQPVETLAAANDKAVKTRSHPKSLKEFNREYDDVGRKTYLYAPGTK